MKEILQQLNKDRVCVVAIKLPNETVHAATLHFSHNDDPLELYFATEKSSRKCQGLLEGKSALAAVVVGFSEEEWKTLQMDGSIQAVLDNFELEKIKKVHYAKHPESKQYENEPETLFLKFTPTWWRFTDYSVDPPTKISSETI
jgi:general stress protein 26